MIIDRLEFGAVFFMREYTINNKYSSADIGIDITADSTAELFVAAGEGLTAIAVLVGDSPCNRHVDIELRADSREQLLVDWLSELIYYFDTEGFIPHRYFVQIDEGDGGRYSLAARIQGRAFLPGIDTTRHGIKGVTYYKLAIEERNSGLACHVVFDL